MWLSSYTKTSILLTFSTPPRSQLSTCWNRISGWVNFPRKLSWLKIKRLKLYTLATCSTSCYISTNSSTCISRSSCKSTYPNCSVTTAWMSLPNFSKKMCFKFAKLTGICLTSPLLRALMNCWDSLSRTPTISGKSYPFSVRSWMTSIGSDWPQ